MNKLELSYLPYELKLKKTFSTSGVSFNTRKGFIVSLSNENGKSGIGDCAPFPEFGSETYEEAEYAVTASELRIRIDRLDPLNTIEESLKPLHHLPALRHGVEQALLSLVCAELNVVLPDLLNITTKDFVKVNAVLGMVTQEQAINEVRTFIKNGYRAIKVKTGRVNFEDDFSLIKILRDKFDKNISIRIDSNGAWNFAQAQQFLPRLEQFRLEYCEQPVQSNKDMFKLKSSTNIPLAADESLRSKEDALDIIVKGSADVLILKPMMLGGLIPTLQIIRHASKSNLKCVVSSSFESAVGRALAVFAASYIEDDTAHGLSVGEYIENDFDELQLPVKNGFISLLRK